MIAERMAALGQPVRIRILDLLERVDEARTQTVAATLGISETDASQHLKVLLFAGIVRRRRKGRGAYWSLADVTPIALYELVADGLRARLRDVEQRSA